MTSKPNPTAEIQEVGEMKAKAPSLSQTAISEDSSVSAYPERVWLDRKGCLRPSRGFLNNHMEYIRADLVKQDQLSDSLVDEVQRRMDAVVDAAVEWHQAGREGAEWFDKAEILSTAIDCLLELRSDPTTQAGSGFPSQHVPDLRPASQTGTPED